MVSALDRGNTPQPLQPTSLKNVSFRCVVAGEKGVGKTSLCRAIFGDSHDGHDSFSSFGGFGFDTDPNSEQSFVTAVPCTGGSCIVEFVDGGREEVAFSSVRLNHL